MPWSANLRRRLGAHRDARRGVAEIVEAEVLGVARSEQAQAYCLQTLFVLKGWSGMVHKLETEPNLAPNEAPSLSLLEWLAVMLVSMHALDEWFDAGAPNSRAPVPSHYTNGLGRLRRWQDAYERTFGGQMLGMLERDLKLPRRAFARRAQALVCMDDRIESLRRALESPQHGIETFGTVGFFGVDRRANVLRSWSRRARSTSSLWKTMAASGRARERWGASVRPSRCCSTSARGPWCAASWLRSARDCSASCRCCSRC
jgi:uncharacterized protein YbcC (UPF0753/DUF2309 family)